MPPLCPPTLLLSCCREMSCQVMGSLVRERRTRNPTKQEMYIGTLFLSSRPSFSPLHVISMTQMWGGSRRGAIRVINHIMIGLEETSHPWLLDRVQGRQEGNLSRGLGKIKVQVGTRQARGGKQALGLYREPHLEQLSSRGIVEGGWLHPGCHSHAQLELARQLGKIQGQLRANLSVHFLDSFLMG